MENKTDEQYFSQFLTTLIFLKQWLEIEPYLTGEMLNLEILTDWIFGFTQIRDFHLWQGFHVSIQFRAITY